MLVEVFVLLLTTSLVWPQDIDLEESKGSLFDQELYESVLDPELCAQHLEEMNAFNFYDVSFRIPQGISRGNFLNYGLYQQCLDLRQEITENNVIEGKHCMITVPMTSLLPSLVDPSTGDLFSVPEKVAKKFVDIQRHSTPGSLHRPFDVQRFRNIQTEDAASRNVYMWLGFRLGVCIPKSCSVSQALDQYFNNTIVPIDYQEGFCRLPNDRPYTAGDYVAMVFFSIIGLITLLSTVYEVTHTFILKSDPRKLNKVYSSCSVYTNTRALFTFRPTPNAINCLDGIRSIATVWIICYHTYSTMMESGFENMFDVLKWYSSPRAIWVWAGDMSVDSFFLMSGLLLVYTSANKFAQMALVKNIHHYYLNRYLRMFPIVATAVLLQSSLMFHMSDGFNWWDVVAFDVFSCQRYWWSALLHVQNYVNPSLTCLPQLWYLSADFQLHLLSPLVLFWALGSRRQGWTAVTVGFLGVLTASSIYCYLTDFGPKESSENNSKYYVNTLTRAPPFFAGMLYGYLLHVYRGKKLQLPTWSVVAGWTCSLTLLSLIMYVHKVTNQEDYSNQTLDYFIYSFKRTIWAVGLGIMIFVCSHGFGGPINWFLSLTVWKFISRISFAMYVFHLPIQSLRQGSAIAPLYFSEKNMFLQIQEDVALTILVSIVVCVLVEAPFNTLTKIFLSGGHQKHPQKENELNGNPNGDLTAESNDIIAIKEAETGVKTAKL